MPLDREARRVGLQLLARGLARPHEVADLAGVSLQVVDYWIKCADINWQQVRSKRLAAAWRGGMRNGPRLVETKKAQRQLAERAKARWDQQTKPSVG
jgi:hypothetical protein